MLHAALFRSSWPHGRIRSIDTAAAAAVPGVVGVFTHVGFRRCPEADPAADRRDAAVSRISCSCRSRPTRSAMSASPSPSWSRPIPYIAEDAASLISAEIESLPPILNWEAANDRSVLIHENAGTNTSDCRGLAAAIADSAFKTAPLRAPRALHGAAAYRRSDGGARAGRGLGRRRSSA